MSIYQKHLFFCTNQKQNGKKCCAEEGAESLRDYAKKRLKKLGVHGKGKHRVNLAGCLGQCEKGPVMVIYPEGTWYTYESEADIDEIIDTHILGGQVVERLKLSHKTENCS